MVDMPEVIVKIIYKPEYADLGLENEIWMDYDHLDEWLEQIRESLGVAVCERRIGV